MRFLRRLSLGLLLVGAVGTLLWWPFLVRQFRALRPPAVGIYFAGSRIEDDRALGGFGPCERYPEDLAGQNWGQAGAVSLVAFPDERIDSGTRERFALRLVNRTEQLIPFGACDSCLFLVQEALDRNGNWRPIEVMREPICGNSFHRVFLGRDQYWEFAAPRFTGTFQTRIRFRLEQGRWKPVDADDGDERHGPRGIIFPQRGGRVIYSNEFDGSVNESQFVNETTDQ